MELIQKIKSQISSFFSCSTKAEQELLPAKKMELEEHLIMKSNFLARITHDLRAPLNGIIGFAELMYHGKVGPVSNEHKEYLGDILTSARQLLLLVNDVMDLSKVEAGKMEFHSEEINFAKILEETSHIFQTFLISKNIQFETKIDPELEKVNIDSARLKQVIYNFVSNAIKCTANNGRVIVRILKNDAKTFRLEVEDNGIGIKKEHFDRLFVEFQQLDHTVAKQYPGTGLGLALIRHIVELQGGKVGVESTYGKGSIFYAILPREFPPKN